VIFGLYLAVLEGLLVATGVVVAHGATKGLVAHALAAAADLLAVEWLHLFVDGIGDDVCLATCVGTGGAFAYGVCEDASRGRSGVRSGVRGGVRGGVRSGVRGGVGSAATAAAVVKEATTATAVVEETATATAVVKEATATTAGVKETTTTAAPLGSFLGLFLEVGGFGEAAVAAGVEGAVVDTEGVDDTRTAGVAAAVGGGFVGAVVAGSTGGGGAGGTVTSYTGVGRAGGHEGETE